MKRYVLPDGTRLVGVHDESECEGRVCIIHSPTDHHLVDWPLHWRNDRGIFERICPHGVGHPDPDQFEYWRQTGREYESAHGCHLVDGRPCCQAKESNA